MKFGVNKQPLRVQWCILEFGHLLQKKSNRWQIHKTKRKIVKEISVGEVFFKIEMLARSLMFVRYASGLSMLSSCFLKNALCDPYRIMFIYWCPRPIIKKKSSFSLESITSGWWNPSPPLSFSFSRVQLLRHFNNFVFKLSSKIMNFLIHQSRRIKHDMTLYFVVVIQLKLLCCELLKFRCCVWFIRVQFGLSIRFNISDRGRIYLSE